MKQDILENARRAIVQIATPYSTGTGFTLADHRLIVTNEHVVRNQQEAVIKLAQGKKQLCKVVFLDELHDLALLRYDGDKIHGLTLTESDKYELGNEIVALGHPYGVEFSATYGHISSTEHRHQEITYLQHDASLSPGNSGGPLLAMDGSVIGINTFVLQQGLDISYALPAEILISILSQLKVDEQRSAALCDSCETIVYDDTIQEQYCPSCGRAVHLPSQIERYHPTGVKATIEEIITDLGYQVSLARTGPNQWEIVKGSALIRMTYHDSTGLLSADASLCQLPTEGVDRLYHYILAENHKAHGLSMSVKAQDVVLSLLIYDQYLDLHTGRELLSRMFQKADDYDDILIEKYGALHHQL